MNIYNTERRDFVSCGVNIISDRNSVGGSMPIRKYDRGSRFSYKTQSQ
jgi:hypothetical protein